MNVVVLTDRPTPTSPARRRALRVARQLAAGHTVELLSLYDGDASGLPDGVEHRPLLTVTKEGDAPAREHGLTPEQLRRIAVAPGGAEAGTLSRLAHVELHLALSTSDADLVVVVESRFTPEVVDVAPAGTRVVTLHPGAPTPENLGALALGDGVVASTDETRHVLEGHLEQSTPWVATEPLPRPTGAPEPGVGADDVTFVACGQLESPYLVTVVEAFLEVTDAAPHAHLRVCVDGEPTGTLRRPINHRGRHGSIDFGPHQSWSGTPSVAAVVVGPSEDDESGEVAAEALARGLPVVVVGSCVASALAGEPGVREVAADPASVQACLSELIARGSSTSPRPASPDVLVTDERAAFWDGVLRDVQSVPSRRDRRLAVEAALALPVDPLLYGTPDLREAEKALMSEHGDLVRWHGRVAEVDDTRLESDVWHRNVVDVAAALEQAGVSHVLISDPHEPGRFAVGEQDRAAVVGALAGSLRDVPVYVDLLDAGNEVRGTVLARQLDGVSEAPVLMVYRSIVTTSRTLVYGPNQGCVIEFWSLDPATRQHLSPFPTITPSRRGPVLPSLTPDATITVADREVATTRHMLETTNDDVTFPIDFVWTWLDDNDDAWRARRDEVLKAAGAELSDPHVAARFVNRDELKYSMRSAAMYAPWVRHHYVVTDAQTPSWLDADHPDVTVVDHREIFADPSALPTFNSHAIESQLHHIPGISEHFVYFNDDFFLGRMLPPTMFFTAIGQACSFQSNAFIPPGPKSEADRLFFAYRKNDRALFEREFGRTLRHGYLHAPYSLRVSLMEELEHKFSAEWEQTMHSTFRSLTDHAFATCLVPAYGVETGRGIHKYIRSRYVRAGSREHQPLMREILARRHLESFCLNDTGENDLPSDEHDTSMAAFMEAYYPVRAPWER